MIFQASSRKTFRNILTYEFLDRSYMYILSDTDRLERERRPFHSMLAVVAAALDRYLYTGYNNLPVNDHRFW